MDLGNDIKSKERTICIVASYIIVLMKKLVTRRKLFRLEFKNIRLRRENIRLCGASREISRKIPRTRPGFLGLCLARGQTFPA